MRWILILLRTTRACCACCAYCAGCACCAAVLAVLACYTCLLAPWSGIGRSWIVRRLVAGRFWWRSRRVCARARSAGVLPAVTLALDAERGSVLLQVRCYVRCRHRRCLSCGLALRFCRHDAMFVVKSAIVPPTVFEQVGGISPARCSNAFILLVMVRRCGVGPTGTHLRVHTYRGVMCRYLLQSYLESTFNTHDQRLFSHCMDREALEHLARRSDVPDPLYPKSQQEVGGSQGDTHMRALVGFRV